MAITETAAPRLTVSCRSLLKVTALPSLRLLVEALERHLRGEPPREHLDDDPALDAAVDIAVRNRLTPFVAPQFSQTRHKDRLQALQMMSFVRNTALLGETLTLSSALTGSGIAHLVMKGPVQQHIVHDNFYLRPSVDIDLLVRRADFLRARDAIEPLGYALLTPSVWWWAYLGEQHLVCARPPGFSVDLHHQLHQPGTPGPRHLARLFDGSRLLSVRGTDIPVMNTSDIQMHTIISIAKALFNREPAGKYIYDLRVSFGGDGQKSPEDLLAYCETQGLAGPAEVALGLLSRIFGTSEPRRARADTLLPDLPDADLLSMVFTPQADERALPRRRQLMWAYCSGQPQRYAAEFFRLGSAELARHVFERGQSARMGRALADAESKS